MFELIISVCMIADPKSCKDVHLTYLGDVPTPHSCMRVGQPEMAKWAGSHPKWSIRKWRCGRVDLARKEI